MHVKKRTRSLSRSLHEHGKLLLLLLKSTPPPVPAPSHFSEIIATRFFFPPRLQEGSYECSCENIPGTKLSSDNHTCVNLNECDVISAGCSHACILLSDVTYCTCPDGFELGDDWKTCHGKSDV